MSSGGHEEARSWKRRRFLGTALGAAAGLAASGCATGRMFGGGGSRTPVHLFPVRVSRDRVIRTTVGLRPFREGGFRLEVESLDEKTVIHNYGHGGSGMSLSWLRCHDPRGLPASSHHLGLVMGRLHPDLGAGRFVSSHSDLGRLVSAGGRDLLSGASTPGRSRLWCDLDRHVLGYQQSRWRRWRQSAQAGGPAAGGHLCHGRDDAQK